MKTVFRNILLVFTALLFVLPADARQKRKKKKVKTQAAVKRAPIPMIYYMESYGSVCCPKDPKWDKEPFKEYVARFNKEHNVHIEEIYSQPRGREGEYIVILPLDELSPALKKKFVEERIVIETPEQQEAARQLLADPKSAITFIEGNLADFRMK